jgi:hypothetical protein
MPDTVEIRTNVETVPIWTLMMEGDMRWLIGRRVEIPVHFDLWMRGARFGRISAVTSVPPRGTDDRAVYVRMDNKRVRKLVRVPAVAFEYMRFI